MNEITIKINENVPLEQLIKMQVYWSRKYEIVNIIKGEL